MFCLMELVWHVRPVPQGKCRYHLRNFNSFIVLGIFQNIQHLLDKPIGTQLHPVILHVVDVCGVTLFVGDIDAGDLTETLRIRQYSKVSRIVSGSLWKQLPYLIDHLRIAVFDDDELPNHKCIEVEEGIQGDFQLFQSITGGQHNCDFAVV